MLSCGCRVDSEEINVGEADSGFHVGMMQSEWQIDREEGMLPYCEFMYFVVLTDTRGCKCHALLCLSQNTEFGLKVGSNPAIGTGCHTLKLRNHVPLNSFTLSYLPIPSTPPKTLFNFHCFSPHQTNATSTKHHPFIHFLLQS